GSTRHTFMSDGFELQTGYPAALALTDPALMQKLYLPEDETTRLAARRHSAEAGTERIREFRIRHRDGSIRWMLRRSVPHRTETGGVGWYGITTDITEQRRLQEEVRSAERLQAMGQLTGGVAHQFNNLLMIISGSTELLLAEAKGRPEQLHALIQIQR